MEEEGGEGDRSGATAAFSDKPRKWKRQSRILKAVTSILECVVFYALEIRNVVKKLHFTGSDFSRAQKKGR